MPKPFFHKLSGTQKPCPWDIGSVKTMWVVRKEDVLSVPSPSLAASTTLPELKVGASFAEYHFNINTVIYEEKSRKTNGGTYYEGSVTGYRAGMDPTTLFEVNKLTDGHYILLIELYSGQKLLLGTIETPYLFQGSTSSGKKNADGTGITFRFSGTTRFSGTSLDIQSPGNPCNFLGIQDFELQEWTYDNGTDELQTIPIQLATDSIIESLASVQQNGELFNATTSASLGFASWDNGNQYFTPTSTINISTYPIKFTTTLQVNLAGGNICSVTFSQTWKVKKGISIDIINDDLIVY